ncbi:MAG: DUF3820 family protein [Pedobacter sp.]|nr:DUF3820 family protein [Pedobacter sp.]MDQ8052550.1 DUF3820 family protein [Pedobacter sp.]
MNPQLLNELVTLKMPFGKYKGWVLSSLPEPYLVWFHAKGFPPGKLGMLLATMYEIKLNGLEYLLTPLK